MGNSRCQLLRNRQTGGPWVSAHCWCRPGCPQCGVWAGPGVLWVRCWSSSGGRVHRCTRAYSTSATRLSPHSRRHRGCACWPRDLCGPLVGRSRPARWCRPGYPQCGLWPGTEFSWVRHHSWCSWCCPQCGSPHGRHGLAAATPWLGGCARIDGGATFAQVGFQSAGVLCRFVQFVGIHQQWVWGLLSAMQSPQGGRRLRWCRRS